MTTSRFGTLMVFNCSGEYAGAAWTSALEPRPRGSSCPCRNSIPQRGAQALPAKPPRHLHRQPGRGFAAATRRARRAPLPLTSAPSLIIPVIVASCRDYNAGSMPVPLNSDGAPFSAGRCTRQEENSWAVDCRLVVVSCLSPLTPIIPAHPGASPVTPIIPALTRTPVGGGSIFLRICADQKVRRHVNLLLSWHLLKECRRADILLRPVGAPGLLGPAPRPV